MAVPIKCQELELELTRWCPATCKHCMRGDRQNVHMSPEIINQIFKNANHEIVRLHKIFITGGEPFCNKNTLKYLLNFIFETEILNMYMLDLQPSISMISNLLIYDEEIMNLFSKLQDKGIDVNISSIHDQYHQKVPKATYKKFKNYDFVVYKNKRIRKKDILNLGRAKENNLGNKKIDSYGRFNYYSSDHISLISADDIISIDSIYVTSEGRFGSDAADASWEMIDEKYCYKLGIDSIFENCDIPDSLLYQVKNCKKIIPTSKYIEDYNKAKEDGCLDIFLTSLNKDIIRNYLINEKSKSRTLIK